MPIVRDVAGPQYTLLLTDTVRRAERAGAELERALERLDGSWAGLHIRPESVLDPSERSCSEGRRR